MWCLLVSPDISAMTPATLAYSVRQRTVLGRRTPLPTKCGETSQENPSTKDLRLVPSWFAEETKHQRAFARTERAFQFRDPSIVSLKRSTLSPLQLFW